MSGFSIGIDKKIPRNFAKNKQGVTNRGTIMWIFPSRPISNISQDIKVYGGSTGGRGQRRSFRREVRNVFLKIAALITLQSICYKYFTLY